MVIKSDIVSRCIVRRIKVVSVGWELSGKCIDFLHKRCYAEILSASSNLILSTSNSLSNLLIRETHLLGFHEELLFQTEKAPNILELVGAVDDVLKLVQKPSVDFG